MKRAFFVVAGLLIAAQAVAEPATRHVVVMEAMRFAPAALNVRVGDEVEWVNRDPFPHTATAASFDTGEIPSGGSKSLRITGRGSLGYICTLHPTMKAVVNSR